MTTTAKAKSNEEIVYVDTIDRTGIESVIPVFKKEKIIIDGIILNARREIVRQKARKNIKLLRKIREELSNKVTVS